MKIRRLKLWRPNLGFGKNIVKASQVCTAARAVIEEVMTQDTGASKKQRDLAEAFLNLSEKFEEVLAAWARQGISSASAVLAEVEKLRQGGVLAIFHCDRQQGAHAGDLGAIVRNIHRR